MKHLSRARGDFSSSLALEEVGQVVFNGTVDYHFSWAVTDRRFFRPPLFWVD